jgi:GntR family transcriptional regulator, transcriptional repressor for pyruvate dehydrogenase complex
MRSSAESTMIEKAVPDSRWHPIRKFRTHEQVLAAIEEQILREHLRLGDRLPSERELAEMLGVSRPSVREALRVLEWMGVVAAGVGSGKDAGSIITAQSSEALTRLLRIHLALSNFSLDDLVNTRSILEAAAAEAASAHANAEGLGRLEQILEKMSGPLQGPIDFNELDTDFHVGIATVSGNKVLAEFMQALRDVMKSEMIRAFERLGPDWRRSATKLMTEHRRVLSAIAAHDGVNAARTVRRHIHDFYKTTDAARRASSEGVVAPTTVKRRRRKA